MASVPCVCSLLILIREERQRDVNAFCRRCCCSMRVSDVTLWTLLRYRRQQRFNRNGLIRETGCRLEQRAAEAKRWSAAKAARPARRSPPHIAFILRSMTGASLFLLFCVLCGTHGKTDSIPPLFFFSP